MNQQDYRFQLENPRLTGHRKQKHVCPACGRKTFTRYVDTHNGCAYVDETVGKCDRLNNCAYHLTPAEFYRQNPTQRDWQHIDRQPWQPRAIPSTVWIPHDPKLVTASHSTDSVFWQWLESEGAKKMGISQDALRRVFDEYMIGATKTREVIFWQIDRQQRVHTGHILPFLPNGKRDHKYESWTHYRLQKLGHLPSNYELRQCFFGEHLLPLKPDAKVGVVESEKTAVIMAALCPNEVWLSTSGCEGINPYKMACLAGRKAVFYPDSGCYQKWTDKLKMCKASFPVSRDLESYPPNTDLIDVLLAEA